MPEWYNVSRRSRPFVKRSAKMNLFIMDATLDDLPRIVAWRMEYLQAMLPKSGILDRTALKEELLSYYRKTLKDGTQAACIAYDDKQEIGFGSLIIQAEEPTPFDPTGCRGQISSLYVRENYRHHGVGGKILNHMLDIAKKKEIRRVYLETDLIDSPLYSDAGFVKCEKTLVFNKNRIHLVK